jgi:hypothetical protein
VQRDVGSDDYKAGYLDATTDSGETVPGSSDGPAVLDQSMALSDAVSTASEPMSAGGGGRDQPASTPADAGGAPKAKCDVSNFYVQFDDWDVSWPDWTGSSTTIRLPANFTIELSGCKKEDCRIGQRRKGETTNGGSTDRWTDWAPDGADGLGTWWNGGKWVGGDGDWNWGGTKATFHDKPGFRRVPPSDYPLYWGGVSRPGCFQFETYVADRVTGKDVDTLRWGMEIDHPKPHEGQHKKC